MNLNGFARSINTDAACKTHLFIAANSVAVTSFRRQEMNWMNELGGILQQYSGAGAAQAPDTVHDDFDQAAQAVPLGALANGLSAAFRSDQTPEFGQMIGNL